MCLNSGIENNAQLSRFVEQGMPKKIVKNVEYTLKKRAAEIRRSEAPEPIVEDVTKSIEGNLSHAEKETSSISPSTKSVNESLRIPKMCGRFLKLQNIEDKSLLSHKSMRNYQSDFIAKGTQQTRQILQRFNIFIENLQQHKLFTVLTKTTQPAHIIALCILGLVLLTVGPDLLDNHNKNITVLTVNRQTTTKSMEILYTSQNQNTDNIKRQTENNDKNNNLKKEIVPNFNHGLAMIFYLGAFAIHFGSQIWMTFVSGLSLYFSLPRHIFGQCQQILFPKYFTINAILSLVLLILFVKYFANVWTLAKYVQFGALLLSAVIEITVRLYLAPPMLKLMTEKYKIEGAIGSGKEIGNIVQGDLVQCPHYQRIHKMFRRIHMIIAIGNIIVLLATFLHLYFLASKIQIH